jgi:hypothetical protein
MIMQAMLINIFGVNFIDIWDGADFVPYSSQSFVHNIIHYAKKKNQNEIPKYLLT